MIHLAASSELAKIDFLFTASGGEWPKIKKFTPFSNQGFHFFPESLNFPLNSSEIAGNLCAGTLQRSVFLSPAAFLVAFG